MLPYYREVIPLAKGNGTIPFVDNDDNPKQLLSWFIDNETEDFLPMQRQSGINIVKYHQEYPKLKIIDGSVKTLMNKDRGNS